MNEKDKQAFKKWFEDFWGEEYDSYRGHHKFQEIAYQAACEYKQKEIVAIMAENFKLLKVVKFYADIESWHHLEVSSIKYVKVDYSDWGDGEFEMKGADDNLVGGKRARQVLKELENNI